MWHWDQGRIAYFQYDNICKIARFVLKYDFKNSSRQLLQKETGLPFAAPETHSPWRNYSRILKLCLLVSEEQSKAKPTPVAEILAMPGATTSDEYFHFLASVFTEPSPALVSWTPQSFVRYPLLFSLKYLLAKFVISNNAFTSIPEIIGAYAASNFIGNEDQSAYAQLINSDIAQYIELGGKTPNNLFRQARESLFVLAQISYLHLHKGNLIVSLAREDAFAIFDDLYPPAHTPKNDRESELIRLAQLFKDGSCYNDFDYPNTVVNDVIDSGFIEGSKSKKTHIVIERNASLRKDFFVSRPTSVCDICNVDTSLTYPWSERIIDLHHLLPLASGTRVKMTGTTFDDLVALCPTCHRATHRFYESWLNKASTKDFQDRDEARGVYLEAKSAFKGFIYAK